MSVALSDNQCYPQPYSGDLESNILEPAIQLPPAFSFEVGKYTKPFEQGMVDERRNMWRAQGVGEKFMLPMTPERTLVDLETRGFQLY